MKRTKIRWLGFSLAILLLVLAIGAIKVYNDIFPMAKAIQLPDIEKISSIEISNGNTFIEYTDNRTIKTIMECFLDAKATRNLSVNDAPSVKEYYIVNIITEDGNRGYNSFIYLENLKWCIEQPYWGVYEMGKDMPLFLKEGHGDVGLHIDNGEVIHAWD